MKEITNTITLVCQLPNRHRVTVLVGFIFCDKYNLGFASKLFSFNRDINTYSAGDYLAISLLGLKFKALQQMATEFLSKDRRVSAE